MFLIFILVKSPWAIFWLIFNRLFDSSYEPLPLTHRRIQSALNFAIGQIWIGFVVEMASFLTERSIAEIVQIHQCRTRINVFRIEAFKTDGIACIQLNFLVRNLQRDRIIIIMLKYFGFIRNNNIRIWTLELNLFSWIRCLRLLLNMIKIVKLLRDQLSQQMMRLT